MQCYMKISEGFVIFVALIQLAKDAAWILMSGQLHQDGWDVEEFPTVVHAECLGQSEHEACEYSEGKVVATEMSEVLKVDKAGEELGRTGKGSGPVDQKKWNLHHLHLDHL